MAADALPFQITINDDEPCELVIAAEDEPAMLEEVQRAIRKPMDDFPALQRYDRWMLSLMLNAHTLGNAASALEIEWTHRNPADLDGAQAAGYDGANGRAESVESARRRPIKRRRREPATRG